LQLVLPPWALEFPELGHGLQFLLPPCALESPELWQGLQLVLAPCALTSLLWVVVTHEFGRTVLNDQPLPAKT
jgi:hypothetical protein